MPCVTRALDHALSCALRWQGTPEDLHLKIIFPDPSVSVGIVMSGKCVADGSVIVVVSPLISRMEDQCNKIESVTRSTM